MPSVNRSQMVMRGFSDAIGSWKIIWMLRRRSLASGFFRVGENSVSPSHFTAPAVGRSSPASTRPSVVLPQPDSPASPSVSPRAISSDTPSTARTRPFTRASTPRRMGKLTATSSSEIQGVADAEFMRTL